jgi:hypothetical protein
MKPVDLVQIAHADQDVVASTAVLPLPDGELHFHSCVQEQISQVVFDDQVIVLTPLLLRI